MSACANCGTEIEYIGVGLRRNLAIKQTLEEAASSNPYSPIDCGHCGHELYDGHGNLKVKKKVADRFAKLKEANKPRDQFTSFVNGQRYPHYGVMKKIEEMGYRMPTEFRGGSDRLAATIGMSHADLATAWRKSEQELRQLGVIKITHPPKK